LLDLRNARKGLAGEDGMETTVTVPTGRLCMRVRMDHATGRARRSTNWSDRTESGSPPPSTSGSIRRRTLTA